MIPRTTASRPRTAMLAAVVGAVALVACGDDDGASSETVSSGDEATSATASTGDRSGVDAELQVRYENPDAQLQDTYTITCTDSSAELQGDDVEVNPEASCEALKDLGLTARLRDGRTDPDVCAELYGGADTAEIDGTVDGEQVNTTADRVDGCAINDWDAVLGPLLPPPAGVEEPTTTG